MIFGYIRKRNNVKYKLELKTDGEEHVILTKDTFAQAVDEDMDAAFFDPPLSLPEVLPEDDAEEDYSTTSRSNSSIAFYVKSKKKLNVKNARVRSSRRIKRL
jgi:hypothetical protein